MNSIINGQINFYETQKQKIINYALIQLQEEYENKDKEIFNSNWRKEMGYIPHGIRKRTLLTIFGKLTYKRHRYKIWCKNKYKFVYLADIALGIKKYQRITAHLQIKILSLITDGKRYQDILDCFPSINVKPNTITNIISRINIDSLENIIIKNVKPIKLDKYLYINIDDTFLNLKENNKKEQFRIRVVLFHNGYDLEKSTENKKILKNSRIFVLLIKKESTINNKSFFENLYKLANSFYSNVNTAKVVISGDGAPWIRSFSKYWPNSVYILDKFHVIRKIRQLFNPNSHTLQPIYEELKTLFLTGNYKPMIQTLSKTWFQDSYKSLKLKQLRYYLSNNEKNKGISNQSQDFNIGCNIESVISNHVKRLLGYGSKAFSKNTYLKMLNLHIANANGINTLDLLKENFIAQLELSSEYLDEKNIVANSLV